MYVEGTTKNEFRPVGYICIVYTPGVHILGALQFLFAAVFCLQKLLVLFILTQ